MLKIYHLFQAGHRVAAERVYHGGIHPGAPVLSPLPVTIFTLGLRRNDFLDCALGTYTAVEVG